MSVEGRGGEGRGPPRSAVPGCADRAGARGGAGRGTRETPCPPPTLGGQRAGRAGPDSAARRAPTSGVAAEPPCPPRASLGPCLVHGFSSDAMACRLRTSHHARARDSQNPLSAAGGPNGARGRTRVALLLVSASFHGPAWGGRESAPGRGRRARPRARRRGQGGGGEGCVRRSVFGARRQRAGTFCIYQSMRQGGPSL